MWPGEGVKCRRKGIGATIQTQKKMKYLARILEMPLVTPPGIKPISIDVVLRHFLLREFPAPMAAVSL